MGKTSAMGFIALFCFAGAAVHGQELPVMASPSAQDRTDKSSYTLFNPTPDSEMRSFCTDRPTKSNLPCTVDAGHIQYEADGFNWTYSHHAGVTQNTYLFTNPTFKLGVTNRIDLEVNIAPLVDVNAHDKASGTHSDATGVGDLYLRAKYNLAGNDSGDFAVTFLPYVKVPTASPGIGNTDVEGGMIAPVSFNLPKGFVLLFDPEIDDFHDASGGGYHASYQGLVNITHALFNDTTSAEAELWGEDNPGPANTVTQTSLDLAAQWLARPNLQFDIGTNIGLNRATPDVQSYIGISQRF